MISLLQDRYRPGSILHFFDVTIVLPLCNFTSHKETIINNLPHFQYNGIEVVVVIQDYSIGKEQIGDFINQYPFINWVILAPTSLAEKAYTTASLINVGIQYASMTYLLAIPPAYQLDTDMVYEMREALAYYQHHFIAWSTSNSCPLEYYMVSKENLDKVGGYQEAIDWNRMHNNLMQRLQEAGVKRLRFGRSTYDSHLTPIPKSAKHRLNQEEDSFELYYHWQRDRFKLSTCSTYLKQFLCHSVLDEKTLTQRRKILLLAPVYNEAKLLPDFINHMSPFCDGMIFLDDGSTDNSYELIEGEKVLLKIKKQREFFDDINNRNRLLETAFFFNAEWLLFMDIDERFDPRYCNLKRLAGQTEFDVFAFSIIHLWNSVDTYNSSFPGSNQGLVRTCRMFQSKGHLQINTQKTLHFTPIPYFTRLKLVNNSILVHHFGHINKDLRKLKYIFYQKEDKQKDLENYEYLIDDSAILKEVSKLTL